ncbi:MAG TPA: glycoside hydrolase family 3 C-terminal domain-containing protein, partial [Phnomibacter sp.]|nr:glycoside hydrolase family 3 C-terminal domain-containing protein [Phnomibacter sp.]
DAVLLAWYPGEQGGHAVADILFGKVSPSGRLPVTFYRSLSDLPAYDNYAMAGRTYRYYAGDVQYPFGYGLSYTQFEYHWARKPSMPLTTTDTLRMVVAIKNNGSINGDEVVQAYVVYPAGERMPVKELKAFSRIHVAKGDEKHVQLNIPLSELRKWDLLTSSWRIPEGNYSLEIGGHSRDVKLSFDISLAFQ